MSTIPDPATTDWVPLQGRPSGAAYYGQWSAARTYVDGDCAIGSDGVLYMCVTDGTTTAPAVWPGAPGPQGVAGPQGPQGVGIPMPVVNGSWIKGIGGAAVWTALTQGQLPGNLQQAGLNVPGADYNNAVDAGWYYGSPTDANRPGAYWCHVQVLQFGGPQYKQIAHNYSALDVFERFYIAGTGWSTWRQTQYSPDPAWRTIYYEVGYVNGFSDYGTPYGPVRFRKLTNGLVVMQGLMAAPGPGLAFTFPAGYKPTSPDAQNLIFHAASSNNLGTETWRIDGNGALVHSNAAGWVSTNGITFYAGL